MRIAGVSTIITWPRTPPVPIPSASRPTAETALQTSCTSVVVATTAMWRGGVWRHIEDLALELRNRGHSCVIGLEDEAVDLRRAAAERQLRVESLSRTARWREWIWHGHLHDTFDRRFAAV